jgi:hypothetical protein
MKQIIFSLSALDYQPREGILLGRRHIIVPVVALVEGVHNGKLYSADEISAFVSTWAAVPVTVGHPRNGEGEFISANDPQVLDSLYVGRMFRPEFDGQKLRAELWIDTERADRLDARILEHISRRKPLEVSTGLLSFEEPSSGQWNGKAFHGIIRDIHPDHLALLPGGEGACNWADGCGVRANEKREDSDMKESEEAEKDEGRIKSLFRSLLEAVGLKTAEVSHEDLHCILQHAVYRMDRPGWVHEVEAVYEENFVYRTRITDPEMMEEGGGGKLYRRSYSLGADGMAVLADDAVEVRKDETYVPVVQPVGLEKEKTEEENMAEETGVKVLTCATADKCQHKDGQCNHGAEHKETPAVAEAVATKPVTLNDYIAGAPTEIQGIVLRSLARDGAAKKALIDGLMKNPRNRFSAEQLEARELDELESLASLAQVEVDYSGGSPRSNNAPTHKVRVLEFESAFASAKN